MLERIKALLSAIGISAWQITQKRVESAEIYYIRQKEDMRRTRKTTEITVTVYRDFEENGKRFRGSSSVLIEPCMKDAEILKKLENAYSASGYVKNPFFELAAKHTETLAPEDELSRLTPSEALEIMSEALFAPDRLEDAFINSAEIYSEKTAVSTLTSEGTDVAYTFSRVKGEFVAQCLSPGMWKCTSTSNTILPIRLRFQTSPHRRLSWFPTARKRRKRLQPGNTISFSRKSTSTRFSIPISKNPTPP